MAHRVENRKLPYCGFRLPAGQAGNADREIMNQHTQSPEKSERINKVNSSNSSNPDIRDQFEQQHGSTPAPMNLKKVPGLYIHIPFCISKCGYCDFYSVTILQRPSPISLMPLSRRWEYTVKCSSRSIRFTLEEERLQLFLPTKLSVSLMLFVYISISCQIRRLRWKPIREIWI